MNKILIMPAKLKAYSAHLVKGSIVLMALVAGLLFWMGQDPPPAVSEKISDKSPLYDLTKSVEDKSLWMFKAQNQLSEQQKTIEQLHQELEDLKKTLKSPAEMDNLNARLEQVEQQLDSRQHFSSSTSSISSADTSLEQSSFVPPVSDINSQEPPQNPLTSLSQGSSGIFSETLSLTVGEPSKLPHKDSFIPPGTYAEAILLSGVDVSAGVSSQSFPQPVLLKLTSKGSLPNKFFGHLTECRLIAAAYGDLSSERAHMRLEKLSCVEPSGNVIVTDVDGYVVSQEDNKNGIPGKVIMKDTKALAKGFMGGLFSGLGKAVTQSYHSTSLSPFGAIQSSNAQGLDILKQAGAQGTGDAFELLAKYNIQRAEQYQPVIQIGASQKVDVVFHSGSEFGEKKVRPKPLEQTNEPRNNLPNPQAYRE